MDRLSHGEYDDETFSVVRTPRLRHDTNGAGRPVLRPTRRQRASGFHQVEQLEERSLLLNCPAFSPEGLLLATADVGGTRTIWDLSRAVNSGLETPVLDKRFNHVTEFPI